MNCIQRLSSLLIAIPIVVVAQDSRAQEHPEKEIVINLEKFGWQPPPNESAAEPRSRDAQVLAIDHHGRVLVGFTVREHEGLATRQAPSLTLHILRFSSDGAPESTISVPTGRWFGNGFYLDSQDRILTKTDEALQFLVQDEVSQGQNQNGVRITTCSVKCGILQSATHKTLQLYDISGFGKGLTYIDTASSPPRVLRRCAQVSPYYSNTITDKFDYFAVQENRRDGSLFRWPFCDYENVTNTWVPHTGAVHALNDESLVFVYYNAVEVVSKDGDRKFLWEMVKQDVPLNEVSSSESGERFAVQIVTYRGGSARLDIGGHVTARRIAVFDARMGQQISSFPLGQIHSKSFSFYLSPDGRELALLEDGTVTVKSVP